MSKPVYKRILLKVSGEALGENGKGVSYQAATELAQQIIIMGRDGVATWSVQLDQGFPSAVAWSPDGTRIAATAASSYQQGPEILYIITAETGERVAVSQNEIEFFFIAWSPDSTRVLYTDVIDRAEEADLPAANLWIYELASGEFVQLTDSPWHDGLGDWSP